MADVIGTSLRSAFGGRRRRGILQERLSWLSAHEGGTAHGSDGSAVRILRSNESIRMKEGSP
jgi:hypothetical protein